MQALSTLDLTRSRRILAEAAEGRSLGRVYADLVRPALVASDAEAADERVRRLRFESVRAGLGAVASRPADGAAMGGRGRAALVSVGAAPLDALDGQVIVDTLCGDGWSVDEVEAGAEAADVAALAEEHRVQLVVMPTANAGDLLLSAMAYTWLRRLPDPPVIVACAFGRPDDTRRARAAGADVFVNDPDDLLPFLDGRLSATGARHWGVGLRRLGDTLVLTPTGDLDERGVARLREVAESRADRVGRLIVDTRDVARTLSGGVAALVGWMREAAAAGRSYRVLPGPLLEARLTAALGAEALAAPADVAP